jgi:hypothetical protein
VGGGAFSENRGNFLARRGNVVVTMLGDDHPIEELFNVGVVHVIHRDDYFIAPISVDKESTVTFNGSVVVTRIS